MAYVQQQQIPEDEQNKFGRTGETTPSPVPAESGGSVGSGTQGQGGSAAPGVGTSTQFGSNAAKLSDYLKVNEPQVQEFGNEVAGNLTQGYNSALSGVDQGYNQFNQDVSKGYVPNNQDLVNRATTDPTNFVKNQGDVDAFRSLYNNSYGGPQNFESTNAYSTANQNVNKAVQNANMVGSESGLKSYLNTNMNKGGGTDGMQTLNTTLLQRSPEASKAIREAAQPYQGLTSYLSNKTNEANQAATTAREGVNQARESLQNSFTGQNGLLPTLKNNLSSRLDQTRQEKGAGVSNAIRDYQEGNATPEQMAMLGFNMDDMSDKSLSNYWKFGQDLDRDYNVNTNYNSIFSPQSADTVYGSPGSVANQDDIAMAQALAQLTGGDAKWLGSTNPAGPMASVNRGALEDMRQNLTSRDESTVTSLPVYNLLNRYSGYGGDLFTDDQLDMDSTPDSERSSLRRHLEKNPYDIARIIETGGIDPSGNPNTQNLQLMTPQEINLLTKAAERLGIATHTPTTPPVEGGGDKDENGKPTLYRGF